MEGGCDEMYEMLWILGLAGQMWRCDFGAMGMVSEYSIPRALFEDEAMRAATEILLHVVRRGLRYDKLFQL